MRSHRFNQMIVMILRFRSVQLNHQVAVKIKVIHLMTIGNSVEQIREAAEQNVRNNVQHVMHWTIQMK